MTPLDLTPIKDREAKASKGPWQIFSGIVESLDGGIFQTWNKHEEDFDNAKNNADFVCNSRTDIPALIAEVERLRAILGEKA